jgi:hypothetical protein
VAQHQEQQLRVSSARSRQQLIARRLALFRIAVSTALFAGAIILTRNFGDYLVPAF